MKSPSKIHRFIFNALKSQMVQLCYEDPQTINHRELKFVFRCSDGEDYYMFDNPSRMPLMRQFAFIKAYNEFIFKFTNIETDAMFKAIKKALEGTTPDLGIIFHILLQYDLRQQDIFFNKDSLFELFAICLVNLKEPFEQLTPEWSAKKKEVFAHDFENGLKAKIYGSPLVEFIPQLENMEKFLNEFTEEASIKSAALMEQLNLYSDGR